MNNPETNITPESINVDDIQRNIAKMAAEDAELVAAAAEAFVTGLQIGAVRATANKQ